MKWAASVSLKSKQLLNIRRMQGIGTVFVFFGIFVFFSLISKNFLTVENLLNILRQISILTIVATGMTVLIIAGQIDLSVGSTLGFCGVVSAMLIVDNHMPIWMALLVSIGIGAVIGLFNGAIVTRLRIPPLLATLGTMTAVRGLAFIVSGGKTIFNLPKDFLWLGRGFLGVIPVPVLVMLVVLGIFLFIQQKTAFSVYTYAVGGNNVAARLSGINDKRIIVLLYVIVGLLTGLGAFMTSSRMGVGLPSAGEGFEFDVIIAVVVGGTSIFGGIGNIQSTLLGALIIGELTEGMIMVNLHSFYQQLAKGLILIIAVGAETVRHKDAI